MGMAGSANASLITSINGPSTGSGTLTGVVSTPASGNNNAPGLSPNTIGLNESITGFNPISGFSLNLNLGPTQTGTEYTVTKTITNNTGFAWNSFTVAVGCSPGPPVLAGMQSCGGNGPLLMDYDLLPTASGSGTGGAGVTTANDAFFQLTGLNLAPGQTMTLTFNLDVGAFWAGNGEMHQYASGSAVPEPATYALTGAGLSGMALLGLLRKRQKAAEGPSVT